MLKFESEIDPLFKLSARDVSYSRLKTSASCGLKYFYQYVVKAPAQYGTAALLGNVIHKAIEVSMDDTYDFELKELLSNYDAAREELDPEHTISDSMILNGVTMLTEFWEERQLQRDDKERELGVDFHNEMDFTVYIGRGCFRGYIDCIEVEEDTVRITDYKCLTAGAVLWAQDGKRVRVDEVKVGDSIIGWNETTGLHRTNIVDINDNGVQPIVSISTLNGRRIKVTPEHPVFTQRGWVEARYLDIEDRILIGLNFGLLNEKDAIELEDTSLYLPDRAVLVDILREGPFDSYLHFQDYFLPYNHEYHVDLVRDFFDGRYRQNVFNMTMAEDLQHILALLGINSAITMSSGTWTIEIDADSKMTLFGLLAKGRLSKDFIASDKIVRISKERAEQTWGITVDGNHTHITNGLVTHNSGKWEATQKSIPTDRQLQIYSLIARHRWPDKKIYAELYYLKSGKHKGHWFTNEELDIAQVELAKEVDELIGRRHFHATKDVWECRMCSYAKDGTCSVGEMRLRKAGQLGEYIE